MLHVIDKPGQLEAREQIVRCWLEGGAGAALTAQLVGVLESVERLNVLTVAGDSSTALSLHHLTKRYR